MSAPLFIPLKTKYFEAFKRGEKTEEFRRHFGPWNERACFVGRLVTLSKGYGKYERLSGEIAGIRIIADPQAIPGWAECYGDNNQPAIAIKIKLT